MVLHLDPLSRQIGIVSVFADILTGFALCLDGCFCNKPTLVFVDTVAARQLFAP